MMRLFLIPALASAMLSTGCGDDDTKADTTGDTIVDTADSVDSGTDSTASETSDDVTVPPDTTTDATTATETTDATTATETTATDTSDDTTTTDTTEPDTSEEVADTTDTADTAPTIGIVINEVKVAGAGSDWIEIMNGGASPVDIGGYLLRDDDPTHSFILPAGTILPAGAYLAIDQGDGTTGFDFGFGDQDGAFLFDRDDTLIDQTVWVPGEAPAGAVWGRYPNGSGNFQTLLIPTKGTANVENPVTSCPNGTREVGEACDGSDFPAGVACADRGWAGGALSCAADCSAIVWSTCTPRSAALVINEVTSGGVDPTDKIELFNGTASSVQLGGYQVKDDADNTYTFPTRVLNAGSYLVLTSGVEFDFGLGNNDMVRLLNTSGTEIDRADWQAGEATVSFCRKPNGTGGFDPCAAASFGAANP